LGGTSYIAHEYFSEWEAIQSSTYRELLGVIRCLQSLIEIYKGELVVVQIDATNLLGIVNRGISRLNLNTLSRELFCFCLSHKIDLSVEWVSRESNAFEDDISKWLIPDDYLPSLIFHVGKKMETRTCDTFSTNKNNQCSKFYSLHWCRGTSGFNGFVFDWNLNNC